MFGCSARSIVALMVGLEISDLLVELCKVAYPWQHYPRRLSAGGTRFFLQLAVLPILPGFCAAGTYLNHNTLSSFSHLKPGSPERSAPEPEAQLHYGAQRAPGPRHPPGKKASEGHSISSSRKHWCIAEVWGVMMMTIMVIVTVIVVLW